MKDHKGVTLIQLLAVIVIMGIIAAVSVITIGNLVKNSRIKADIENVNVLNQATYLYFLTEDENAFLDLESEEDKIRFLVDKGYLNKVVSASFDDSEFIWDDESNYWIYTLFDQTMDGFDNINFNDFNVDSYEHIGDWEAVDGNVYSDYGMLFIDNPHLQYTITVLAKIEDGTYGGFGILFDSFLIDGEDTGYILQLDRGYGRGSVVIRPRENGDEGNVIQAFRFDHSNSFIPDKNTEEGAIWWNSAHKVELSVILIEGVSYTKVLSVKIDDQLLFNDFQYVTGVGTVNNFTGLRTWSGVEVEFQSFNIN